MRRLVEEHGVHLQVASGGVPRFLRRSESDFPHRRGFLSASEERIAQWRDRLAGLGRQPKVGISWIGGGDPTERRRRSLPLLQWRQLLQRRDVQFVNLQYGDCEEQLRQAEQQLGVRIHSFADVDPLKELDNFAALVRSLDLVISVTNATVHLAGSLGVAVLALIPGVAPWRWLEQRGDSPWYGSVQLVRRGTEESEAHLLHRVSRQLDESLGTRTILHDAARKNMPPATAFSLAENWIRSTRNADGPLGP
jgi:ADP-heptose:LPS heptosyltransferase